MTAHPARGLAAPLLLETGTPTRGLTAAMIRLDFANEGSGIIEIGTGSFTRSAAASRHLREQPIRWQEIPIQTMPIGQATFMQWSYRTSKERPWRVVRSERNDSTPRRVEPLEIMGIFDFV